MKNREKIMEVTKNQNYGFCLMMLRQYRDRKLVWWHATEFLPKNELNLFNKWVHGELISESLDKIMLQPDRIMFKRILEVVNFVDDESEELKKYLPFRRYPKSMVIPQGDRDEERRLLNDYRITGLKEVADKLVKLYEANGGLLK